MRVIGLLSWYEEPASWLAECVAAAARLCDHLIAVDGPYAAFPGALRRPASSTEQAETILHTAAGAGIGCTIHAPRQPWWGGEVEKRSYMFRLGLTMAESDDWFLVFDADEVLVTNPADARKTLAETELDVAEVMVWERGEQESRTPHRRLFRALPGITYRDAHYVVTVPTDTGVKVLSGNPAVHDIEPAQDLWDTSLEHRKQNRSVQRKRMKADYYAMVPTIEQVKKL